MHEHTTPTPMPECIGNLDEESRTNLIAMATEAASHYGDLTHPEAMLEVKNKFDLADSDTLEVFRYIGTITSTSSSSTNSSDFFYKHRFVRPKSIPTDLFADSVEKMNAALDENPFNRGSNHPSFKPCRHWGVRLSDLSQCVDCKQRVPEAKIEEEEKIAEEIEEADAIQASLVPHHEMLHNCAVTVDFLLAFTFDHDCWSKPTWWVNRHIIRNATSLTRCRFVDLHQEYKSFTGAATVFVSHCWGAPWGDAVLAASTGARPDRLVWFDIFAVRQWPGNVADLVFRNVIKRCTAVIASVSPVAEELRIWNQRRIDTNVFFAKESGKMARRRIPFFRLWCNVEIAFGASAGKNIVVKGGSARRNIDGTWSYDSQGMHETMLNLSQMIDIESCESTKPEDKERELNIIYGQEGGVDLVNESVRGVVLGASQTAGAWYPLVDSTACGEMEHIQVLMSAYISDPKNKGQSILDFFKCACAGGRLNVVQEISRILLTHKNTETCLGQGETKTTKQTGNEVLDLVGVINTSGSFVDACSGGHLKLVQMLTEIDGIDMNAVNKFDETGLFKACENNFPSIVKFLLENTEKGLNPNQRRNDKLTPFHMACSYKQLNIVSLFLACPCVRVNRRDFKGRTSLLSVCFRNEVIHAVTKKKKRNSEKKFKESTKLNIMNILLESDRIDVNKADRFQVTPLAISCRLGDPIAVKMLLNRPEICESLNVRAADGSTPLLMACNFGHATTVELLLKQNGIDVNLPMKDNATPLMISCQRGYTDVVCHLLTHKNIDVEKGGQLRNVLWTPLKCAVATQRTKIVKILQAYTREKVGQVLTVEESISARIAESDFPTSGSSGRERMTAMSLLIHAGSHCDVNVLVLLINYWKDGKGETKSSGNVIYGSWLNKLINDSGVLVRATLKKKIRNVELLIDIVGVDINQAVPSLGCLTALQAASRMGYVEIVRVLLKNHSVNLNCCCINGHTPLFEACMYGHFLVVQVLLNQSKTDINLSTNTGYSPLHLACQENKLQIANLLLSRDDVNINTSNCDGVTPLIVAAKCGNNTIVRALLGHPDINPNIRAGNGQTALDIAHESSHRLDTKKDAHGAIIDMLSNLK